MRARPRVIVVSYRRGQTELVLLMHRIHSPAALIVDSAGQEQALVDATWRPATAAEAREYWRRRDQARARANN